MVELSDIKSFLCQESVAKMICVTCGLFILIQIIGDVRTFFYYQATINRLQPVYTQAKQSMTQTQACLKVSLFGVYVPKNIHQGVIKRSTLHLKVVGIILSEGDSQVILRDERGHEQSYRVGEKLPGGAVVKRITSESVVVEHDGDLESLSLPKNELFFAPVPTASVLP